MNKVDWISCQGRTVTEGLEHRQGASGWEYRERVCWGDFRVGGKEIGGKTGCWDREETQH